MSTALAALLRPFSNVYAINIYMLISYNVFTVDVLKLSIMSNAYFVAVTSCIQQLCSVGAAAAAAVAAAAAAAVTAVAAATAASISGHQYVQQQVIKTYTKKD